MSARNDVEYVAPTSVGGARRALADAGPDAKIAAGGQSLMLLLRRGFVDPAVIVDVGSVPALVGIDATGDAVRIGAATTYADLGDHPTSGTYAAVGDAVDGIADPQVRAAGTVGGAVSHADPSLDIVPPLLVLDASVHVGSVNDSRSLPLREFLRDYMVTDLGDAELVEAVTFPARDGVGTAYEKHATVHGGWATVGVASLVELTSDGERVEAARVALAAVADTAVRAPSVEAALEGERATDAVIDAAAAGVTADIDPIEDLSGSVAYKEHVAEHLTARCLGRAVERAGGAE